MSATSASMSRSSSHDQAAVWILSFHVSYACRELGSCCDAGWPIPIEIDALSRAQAGLATGRLQLVRDVVEPFPPVADAPAETPALVACTDEGCVFHRAEGPERCGIQRSLGTAAMPQACRQFPRVALRDPRGWSVTLSAACPSAAALLEDDIAPAIERIDAGYMPLSGLDATGGLPPALRPDMLMGWADWWEWERRAVECLRTAESPPSGLDRLAGVIAAVRSWAPGDGALGDRIDEAFDTNEPRASRLPYTPAEAIDDLLSSVPERWQPDARRALVGDRAVPPAVHRRALIAHAFANWTAHLGQGLRTWLRSIEAVHLLLDSGVAVANVDLVVRHLADPQALATRWGVVEDAGAPTSSSAPRRAQTARGTGRA